MIKDKNIENDEFFYINWEDSHKKLYRIGVLARVDGAYFLKTFSPKGNNRVAFNHGFVGIPGFSTGELYKSKNQLFDFFMSRVITAEVGKKVDYLNELKKTKGIMFTDSFSVEEFPESLKKKCKNFILRLDEIKRQEIIEIDKN